MTNGIKAERKMTPKSAGTAWNRGQVVMDMLGLVLRGTIAAIAIAAMAMGLIALAAS